MKPRLALATLFFTLTFLMLPAKTANAQEGCKDRFVTLVNPVRTRHLWEEKSIAPLLSQYQAIKDKDLPATWLLQYDTLSDIEIVNSIHGFNEKQEVGIFLEVSPKTAKDSRVLYPPQTPWFFPNAIFLSGYDTSQRRKLIDNSFGKFKETFGHYPKSIGAWWIDSYSLNYIEEKYDVDTALIVADQKTTDNYGVWGQWWGVPYFPSKQNILVPGNDDNSQDIVVIQWAQRDLAKAYGKGPDYSNYSLQANDYIEEGLDTEYFLSTAKDYLSCDLKVGQITVGMETGMEAYSFHHEYTKQLDTLVSITNLQAVTMSDFKKAFSKAHPKNPEEIILQNDKTQWILSLEGRQNKELKDSVSYNQKISFSDYFVKDNSTFLNRNLQTTPLPSKENNYFPFHYLVILLFSVPALAKRKYLEFLLGIAFLYMAYGSYLRAFSQFGWNIYFGPVFHHIAFTQVAITTATISVFIFMRKSLLTALLPLSFGISYIIFSIRYTLIQGTHHIGFLIDELRFVGIGIGTKPIISLIHKDLEPNTLVSLIGLSIKDAWASQIFGLALYPLINVAFAFGIWLIIKNLRPKMKIFILIILFVLLVLHLVQIFSVDPNSAFTT